MSNLMRKNEGSYTDDGPVYAHMQKILRYLWDEGPHQCKDIEELLGLTHYRTLEIIGYLRCEGLTEKFRHKGRWYFMVKEGVELDKIEEIS